MRHFLFWLRILLRRMLCTMNFVFLIFVALAYVWYVFDKMVTAGIKAKKNWASVESQIKRRFIIAQDVLDLIKSFGIDLENKIIVDDAIRTQNNFLKASNPNEIMKTNKQLTFVLMRLFDVCEKYNELKISVRLATLKDSLIRIEDKIIYEQQFYNSSVEKYNQMRVIFPNNIYVNLIGFKQKKYFNSDEFERSLIKPEEDLSRFTKPEILSN